MRLVDKDKLIKFFGDDGALDRAIRRRIESQPEVDMWIPISQGSPEEYKCLNGNDYYGESEHVLCSTYNECTNEYEMWIDYTIDGEWQEHEYYEGEKLAWMPLPDPYKN